MILLKIKNTMSDRHAAEKLFCSMLAEYREEVIPELAPNWSTLSVDEQHLPG